MLADIIFPRWVPIPYLAIPKDTAGFIKAHDIALNNYDFDTLVGGHLTRLGTRKNLFLIWKRQPLSEPRSPVQQDYEPSRTFR